MADGMSILFEIDSKTPGLDTLLASLDKTNASLLKGHAGLKALDDGMKHGSEGAKTLGGAFDKAVKQGLEPFLHKAEQIAEFEFIREGVEKLLEFPGELAHKIVELGEDALMTAAKTERMGLAFENALGTDVGKEAMEYFDAIADKTEFTHEQLRGMGLELAKFGFKDEGLKNAAAAIADLGAMSGNGLAGAEEATSALERIKTTGRVDTKGLVHFAIDQKDFLKELGGESGLGGAAAKALEAGKIPIETVLNSLYSTITNKTGKELGELGTHMADTLEGRLAHLKEKPDLFFEKLKDSRGFHEFSDAIAHLGDTLDPNSPTGKQIFGALESTFNAVGDAVSNIDFGAVAETITDDVLPAIKSMASLINPMFEFMEREIRGLHVLHDLIFGHVDEPKALKAIEDQKWGQPVDELSFLHKAKHPTVKGAETGNDVTVWHGQMHMIGTNDVKGYAGGIDDATPEATKAMDRLGEATVKTLKDAHEQHSPSRLFAGIGEMDAEGYAQGTEDSASRIADAMETTYRPPSVAALSGGGTTMTVGDINLTVEITSTAAGDGQALGRAVLAELEEEFEPLLVRALEGVVKRRGS